MRFQVICVHPTPTPRRYVVDVVSSDGKLIEVELFEGQDPLPVIEGKVKEWIERGPVRLPFGELVGHVFEADSV